MIKKILFLFSLCIPSLMFGQNQLQPLLNMPTPQAASIGRFGQIPVDYSTGMPNLDIPLYNIKLDNIELPISCKYHLASVKPDGGFGIMGLGWSLSSGGCITRNVNYLPDELIDYAGRGQYSLDGYFKHANMVDSIKMNQYDLYDKLRYSRGETDPTYELAADEFSFNFCGYSGNFYYGSDRKWHVCSDQRIIVEFDPTTGFATNETLADSARIDLSKWKKKRQYSRYFNKFKIITPDGTKYYFGGVNATEYSIDYYARNNSYMIPTSWYLTKIVTTKGHEINLRYKIGKPNCKIDYSPAKVEVSDGTPFVDNTTGDACNSGFLLFPIYLETIETPNEKITYDYQGRSALKTRYFAQQLVDEEPSLLPEGMFAKIWDVAYGEDFLCFLNPSRTLSESASYVKKIQSAMEWELLKKVTIESKRNTYLFSKIISYDPLETNNCSIIHGYHYDFNYSDGYSPKLQSIKRRPNAEYPDTSTAASVTSSSIQPLSVPSTFGSLDTDTSTPDNEPTDGDPYIVPPPRPPVTYGDTVSTNYVYTFGYHGLPDYLQENGEPIRRYHREVRMNSTDYWGYWNGSGRRSYAYREIFSNQLRDSIHAIAQTLSSISYPTGGLTTFEYEPHYFEFGVSPDRQRLESPYIASLNGYEIVRKNIESGAGLRVKSITTQNNGVNTTKTFEYITKDGKSSGILNTMPSTGSIYNLGDDALYRQATHGFSIPMTKQNSALVNYTRVKVKTEIDNVSNGNEVYYYTSYTDYIDGESLFDKPANVSLPSPYNDYAPVATTSKASARFKLKKKEVYSASDKLLQTDEYEYTASPNDKENYIRSVIHTNMVYPTYSNNVQGKLIFKTEIACKGFLYRTYLNSYFPSKKTTKTYVQNSENTVDTQTTYTYNQDKQLCSELFWGPNNTLLQTTEYMYPNDITLKHLQLGGNNKRYDAYAALDRLNIVTAPIAQTVKKGDKVVSCNVALYDLIDGFPVKTDDYTLKEKVDTVDFQAIQFISGKETPVHDKLKKAYSYGEFDKYHNPCYVWNKQRKLVLIWDYNGQTLAGKIENIDLDDVQIPVSQLGSIHSLREKLPHAQITQYEVNPFLGLTFSTDKRGLYSAFRYDTLGRLILSGSQFGDKWNINNVFDYNYKP